MKYVYILIAAVLIDFIIGDPPTWPHPIRFIGGMIKKYENVIRHQKLVSLKVGGFFLTFLSLATVTAMISLMIFTSKSIHPVIEIVVSTYLTYTALAAKCLSVETKKVYRALKNRDIGLGRKMLSYLVGRDTTELNEEEIIRGAVETVAENTIDGVLAPLFYYILGVFMGVPLQMVFIYKTINTLDSMVGYIQEKYKEIGFASAKIDDIANYIPARLGSLFMLVAGLLLRYDFKAGLKTLKRDRRNHKSPNCGYPESAVAGLLNVQLGGTNTYFGETLYKPTIGDAVKKLSPQDIIKAIQIMYGAEVIMVMLFILPILIFK